MSLILANLQIFVAINCALKDHGLGRVECLFACLFVRYFSGVIEGCDDVSTLIESDKACVNPPCLEMKIHPVMSTTCF